MKLIRSLSLIAVSAFTVFTLSACSAVEEVQQTAEEAQQTINDLSNLAQDLQNTASDVSSAFENLTNIEDVPSALAELFGVSGTSIDKLSRIEVTNLETNATTEVTDHALLVAAFSGIDPSQWTYTLDEPAASTAEYEFVLYQYDTINAGETASDNQEESQLISFTTYADSNIISLEVANLPISLNLMLPASDIQTIYTLIE